LQLIAKGHEQHLILTFDLELYRAGKIDYNPYLIRTRLAETHATHWSIVAGNRVPRFSEPRPAQINHNTRGIA
jgi:hypothetical protein